MHHYLFTIPQHQPAVVYVTSATLSGAEAISAILSQSACRFECEFLEVREEKKCLLIDPLSLTFE